VDGLCIVGEETYEAPGRRRGALRSRSLLCASSGPRAVRLSTVPMYQVSKCPDSLAIPQIVA
jgi:hypothetical protein